MSDVEQVYPRGHAQGWPMHALRPGTTDAGWVGACSCRWRGPWRSTGHAAMQDLHEHGTIRIYATSPEGGTP